MLWRWRGGKDDDVGCGGHSGRAAWTTGCGRHRGSRTPFGSFWAVNDWIGPGETVERAVYCPSPGECDTLPITMDKVILGKAPRSGIGVLKLTVQGRERMVPVLSKGEVRHTFKWSASNEPKPSSSLGIVGDLTGWNPQPAKKVEGSEDTYTFDAILRPGWDNKHQSFTESVILMV